MYYQLKAVYKDSKPPVWRRIVVPSNITFSQLAVILEELLELQTDDAFVFEFFAKKERMTEWFDSFSYFGGDQYTYRNAPDTYIDSWMEKGKSFVFRKLKGYVATMEYRITVEKIATEFKIMMDGEAYLDVNFPIILKQISDLDLPCLKENPNEINERMIKLFQFHPGASEYLYASDIRKQIASGRGITFNEEAKSRSIHTMLSYRDILRNAILQKKECKMVDSLKAYSKDELLTIAEEEDIPITSGQKDKIAFQLARYFLDMNRMRKRLLLLSEEELDAFEQVIEQEVLIPDQRLDDLLNAAEELFYLCRYTDKSVQVPEEVEISYGIIKKNGYRDYHRKAFWLLQCIEAANTLYISTPLDVLFQMYQRNLAIRSEYVDFLDTLKSLPEEYTESVILNDKLIESRFYEKGSYRKVEAIREKVPFYIPEKEETEIRDTVGVPYCEPIYIELFRFFTEKAGFSPKLAKLYCMSLYEAAAAGVPLSEFSDRMLNKGKGFTSKNLQKGYEELIQEAIYETRMPKLCGHNLREMDQYRNKVIFPAAFQRNIDSSDSSEQSSSEKKIYPNDPCPCGSGKKYKKCCGRK